MNLKVGVIFREEEYEPQTATMTDLMNGIYPKTVRPAFWCGYDTAFDEKVPKPKTINKVETAKYVETLQQECDKNQNRSKTGHFSSIISIVSI